MQAAPLWASWPRAGNNNLSLANSNKESFMDAGCRRIRVAQVIIPMAALCIASISCARASDDQFYGTVGSDGKLVSIDVRDASKVTITSIGPTGTSGCASLALAGDGTLFSMFGPGVLRPGPQQLAKIDPKTGHAT